jgi:hypothetical protein
MSYGFDLKKNLDPKKLNPECENDSTCLFERYSVDVN